ncbi:MAG: tRNA threonylcarbamoyladenosine dehydratase [Thermoplasmata archaeon]|jgi:tRNA A37 threonylcarbamoyladenosine dehydratase|nr:tRNA threonylcarbamoyladenosine dehydratase [Thermoplasmata archaeon]
MNGMAERTSLIIGEDGISKLRGASVIQVGCGAVGGYSLEGLVRAGVGRIRVVDHDVFSESNLNRQILATMDSVGRTKVKVACERVRSINPDIEIEGMDVLVNEDTVAEILSGDYDVVVDAIDTLRCKVELLRKVSELGIRTFSSMGAALHLDTQAVRVAPLVKTKVCPLAASVRKALRDCDTSMITAVYSEEAPLVKPQERDDHGKSVLGSLPTVPAVFGMTLANETIKYILDRE